MFNRFELIAGALSVVAMASALYLAQSTLSNFGNTEAQQVAQVAESSVVVVPDSSPETQRMLQERALREAIDERGNLTSMVIDDIKVGTGTEVKDGDTVLVHYAGSFQEGGEFDNSRNRGEAFEFKVGAGMVIKGWEEGLIGMKEGGERILVIPPEKAYGEQGIGPIPPNSTLVFKIELLEVK